MKQAKIMLTTITVMAFVGGALAFKAQKINQLFCTRLIEHGPGVCEGPYIGNIDPNQVNDSYYTVTDNLDDCTNAQCTSTAFFTDK
jgi:hypothetical protein